jgi:L,D-peptidoglycan transpeptidase YkuD (ErfK/YbiS/YcfS/YnhG family)
VSKNSTVIGNKLFFSGKTYYCAVGKSGFSDHKKESDGCTPLGIFPLRECWYRADRMPKPKTGLPLRIIHEDDGWCDDAENGEYNRHVKINPPPGRGREGWGSNVKTQKTPSLILPLPGGENFSHEHLWRKDHIYDLIVPIGYNDDPVVPGKGSAIFLHIATPDYVPTEGCVALAKEDLLAILPHLDTNSVIEIRQS